MAKPDVSAERREQIFQAAMLCFSRKGYYQTTMDDIVAESGLSKGALYWYFKSKKELFLSLVGEMMGQFGLAWESITAKKESSATARLRSSLALFRAELGAMVPFLGVTMEAWALTRHDEEVENFMREIYRPYLDIMHGVINDGLASGEFNVASVRATSLVVMSLLDGIALALATGVWQHDLGEITDAVEELVLRGLGVVDEHGER
jgi:AcrR family transcriptional regulator